MTVFAVAGHPVTQGSKKVIPLRNGGHALVESAGDRLTQWRHAINTEARALWDGPPLEGPVVVTTRFELVRPKSEPKSKPSLAPAKRGLDVDKAARAILDAITGVCFIDDAQVADLIVKKRWAPPGAGPGVTVTVAALNEVDL